jgi:xylose isomerase
MGKQLLASFYHLTHLLVQKMPDEKVKLLLGTQNHIIHSPSLEAGASTVHPNKL